MSIHSSLSAAAYLLLAASVVAAQEREACPRSPGAAFGITSINCAGCAISQDAAGLPSFVFFAEPVVLETAPNGPIIIGDIVEAVNGRPITTRAGAEAFTHTLSGPNEITVRRGRDRRVIPMTIPVEAARCPRSARANKPLIIVDGSIVSEQPATPIQPLIIIDGSPVDIRFDNTSTGSFGLAVACTSACSAASGMEGVTRFTYYRYTTPPPIIAVRPGGPADAPESRSATSSPRSTASRFSKTRPP